MICVFREGERDGEREREHREGEREGRERGERGEREGRKREGDRASPKIMKTKKKFGLFNLSSFFLILLCFFKVCTQ